MSRVLVTGGAGFIGSHVVDKLRDAGHDPRIFDVRPSPFHPDGEIETVLGSVCDIGALRRAMDDCDAVMHLAAAADVGEVAKAPVASEELNSRGTLCVLEAARDAGVARVVYASTIWVYSDVEAERVDEETALQPPAHLYTATKLAGELYCRSYSELYGIDYTVLRFGIPYGPRARPAAVVPAFVGKALAGEPLTIAGTGEQSRRFVYVEDLAEGVVAALDPGAVGRVYNLVGTEDVTVRQIADTVRDVVGDAEIVHTEGRAGDFAGAVVSGERAASELGWEARTPFAEGLRRYVTWHMEANGSAPAVGERADVVAVTPVRAPQRRRVSAALTAIPRNTGLMAAGGVAGLLAGLLMRMDLFADPPGFLTLVLGLLVAAVLLTRADWVRSRFAGVLVVAAMLGGIVAALFVPDVIHLVRHRYVLQALALAVAALVGGGVARRLARA